MPRPTDPHQRLRKLLAESGLRQWEFAAALGVDDATIERWLAGRTIPKQRAEWLENVTIRVTSERVHLTVVRRL